MLAYNPQWAVNHIFGDDGKKLGIDDLLQGPMAATWCKSKSNELARLSNGIPNRVQGKKAVCDRRPKLRGARGNPSESFPAVTNRYDCYDG